MDPVQVEPQVPRATAGSWQTTAVRTRPVFAAEELRRSPLLSGDLHPGVSLGAIRAKQVLTAPATLESAPRDDDS